MLRPWNKASLGHCVPDRCVPTLDRVKHATSSVGRYRGLRRLMDQWGVWPSLPTPLTRFIGLAPLRRMHARPTHRIKSKVWDGSVRGKIAKGHFVQGMQHPRILVGDTSVGDGLTLHPLSHYHPPPSPPWPRAEPLGWTARGGEQGSPPAHHPICFIFGDLWLPRSSLPLSGDHHANIPPTADCYSKLPWLWWVCRALPMMRQGV